jgi:phage-related protein
MYKTLVHGRQFESVYTLDSDIVIAGSIDFTQINPAQAMFNIIATWGYGYLKRDNFDIKILILSGIDTGVLIKYGENIQGIKVTNDSTDVL